MFKLLQPHTQMPCAHTCTLTTSHTMQSASLRPCSALASCFTAQILSPCAGTRGSIDTHTKGTGFPESSRFLDRWLEPVFDVEVVECIEHFSQGLHVRSTISKELPPVVWVLEVLG